MKEENQSDKNFHGEWKWNAIRNPNCSEATLRDYFASQMMDVALREIQDVSQCDDADLLERFGTEEEKEQGFGVVISGHEPIPWKNIELRAVLEARARARLRYIEADAMLDERLKG